MYVKVHKKHATETRFSERGCQNSEPLLFAKSSLFTKRSLDKEYHMKEVNKYSFFIKSSISLNGDSLYRVLGVPR